MNISKKFDRAFQWAGEKMGAEAKTNLSDDFKMLENEMAQRYDGMDRLQKATTVYVKWAGRRDAFEEKEKMPPMTYLARTMTSHGGDFAADNQFGECLTLLGGANEQLAAHQDQFVSDTTVTWLESLERTLAMMKEYQTARKKLESRRLAYDASLTKMQKAKREDFRVEEELRSCRAKYEETNEDVLRRMQDIKDGEADSIRDLTGFLNSELEYHEKCVEELRRVKNQWPVNSNSTSISTNTTSNYGGRSRSNTAHSYSERLALSRTNTNNSSRHYDDEPAAAETNPRLPIRSNSRLNLAGATSSNASPEKPPRPAIGRASTYQPGVDRARAVSANSPIGYSNSSNNNSNTALAAISQLRSGGLRPVGRIQTSGSYNSSPANVFDDNEEAPPVSSSTGRGSPEYTSSPATSYGSLSRNGSTANLSNVASVAARKPPPPPPNRSKKPPPPPAPRREVGGNAA